MIYDNVGPADRLDFTVIGPAVNLVSRLEGAAKMLNRSIVVSDDFARVRHALALTGIAPAGLRQSHQGHTSCLPGRRRRRIHLSILHRQRGARLVGSTQDAFLAIEAIGNVVAD